MGMTWTKEQEKVIWLRDRNILVSAAAGSGKTAVLVERILQKLTDSLHPVDIDKLLIMTFTRAAAGEMKSRLSRALEDALGRDPENVHLQRQTSLIHNAQITTIDGFCSYILKNYFHLIGLDPGYRIADEGELKLLRTDVVRELLEDAHREGREEFVRLVNAYAPGKTDEAMERMILRLYEFSTSAPWPEEWLRKSICEYEYENLLDSKWMELLWEDTNKRLKDMWELALENLALCQEEDGPSVYGEAAAEDEALLGRLRLLAEKRAFDGMAEALGGVKWKALSRKKDENASLQKKEEFKAKRSLLKDTVADLKDTYFCHSLESVKKELAGSRESMEELVSLTLEFGRRFARKKRQKNVLDFSDMEHFALQILEERDENQVMHPTEAARELSEKYEEILVDEYQDSNLVQETLMNLVSGWAKNRKNLFMVGDVKQSIYRFRLARPELFMEKFHTYTLTDSKQQRIDLSRNFRSRREVLDAVNYIFRKIMGESLGGVEYDETAALYPGACFPEGGNSDFPVTEALVIEKDASELEDERSALAERETEALAIAMRIREIMERESVYDKDLGKYRPVQYGDIVILLRTVSGWAEDFGKVLEGQGIPVYTASRTGYFSALEVVTVLNYLRICDNFRQEIPLAAVLHSPFGDCTLEELACLKNTYPELPLYEQAEAYVREEKENTVLLEKLRRFFAGLEDVRERAPYTPIHQLILYVLDKSGYQDYVCAMPAGEQRKANLNMLVEKAMEYEKTSYRGLFNFVRYVETLQKYEVDFGEVSLSGGSQAVQIMSIHKSKGLEFPIVFVAGMGKKFNLQDVNASMLIHPELGVAADLVNLERRTKSTTLLKKVIGKRILEESLGEELRILYVAMTRAREKLILTGTLGKLRDYVVSLHGYADMEKERLPFTVLSGARTYWAWVLPALARHRSMDKLYLEYGMSGNFGGRFYGKEGEFILRHITPGELLAGQIEQLSGNEIRREALENWNNREGDAKIREELWRRFSYEYPYAYLSEIPVKVTVSELKRSQGYAEESMALYEQREAVIPRFAREDEKSGGVSRGNAYHRVLERLDYGEAESEEDIRLQLDRMLLEKKLDQTEYAYVRAGSVWRFVSSSLGQRIKRAALQGKLKREQPFVISSPASAVRAEWKSKERVLIQGIIDAYFEEDGELVIVDYKTDRVRRGEEGRLVDLYGLQLAYYGEALERMARKRVKEKIIYSITLQKEIPV